MPAFTSSNMVACVALASCTGLAGAQSATIQVFHDDLDGIIDPGQVVRIDFYLTWDTWPVLASMKGDARASPNHGLAANPVNGFNHNLVTFFTRPGVPDGGSIRDFCAQHEIVTGFVAPGFGWTPQGITALSYQWTAPGPEHAGPHNFTFEFDPAFPAIALYPGPQTGFVYVPTTVVPVTLTVIPAPSSLALLAALCLRPRWRRRA